MALDQRHRRVSYRCRARMGPLLLRSYRLRVLLLPVGVPHFVRGPIDRAEQEQKVLDVAIYGC